MKVRIVTTSGVVMYGSLLGEEATVLSSKDAIDWVMNNGDKFIKYLQPNGQEVLLNKKAIQTIAAENNYD